MLINDSDFEEVDNWVIHMAGLRKLIPSIYWFTKLLDKEDICGAYQIWEGLSDYEQGLIWNPAPSKGGILTTRQRELMRTNEWAKARVEYHEKI